MIEITTPEVSWIAILPELVLALGAVGVLLVEVQWKPATRVLGAISAITLVIAIFFTFHPVGCQEPISFTLHQTASGCRVASTAFAPA